MELQTRYIALGRETQQFHVHLLIFLLLQQLQSLQQHTEGHEPRRLGNRAQTLCVEAFSEATEAVEAAKTLANAYEISQIVFGCSYLLRPQLAKRNQEWRAHAPM